MKSFTSSSVIVFNVCYASPRALKLTNPVKAAAKQIHRLCELMSVNKRAYNDKRAEYIPKPVCACGKAVVYAAPSQLSADTAGKLMKPNDIGNAKRNYADKEEQKAVMHSPSPVISAADYVNIR